MGAFARNRNGKTDITIYKLPRREGSVCATLSSAFGVFLYVLSSQMNIIYFIRGSISNCYFSLPIPLVCETRTI